MIHGILKKVSIFALIFSFPLKALASDVESLASWVALDAPTGYEHLATNPLMDQLEGWSVDKNGNMYKTIASDASDGLHRIVACALDAPSFTVSQITEDGYLRLHHVGRAPSHPLWSASHEGQQLRILTRKGPVVGVSAFANGHFSNLHRHETALTRADDIWIDVGATSVQDVADMGISLLDPVIRHIPAWSYSDEVAGPNAGARFGCAVVVAGAEAGISGKGTTTWMLSTQRVFNWVGMSSAVTTLAPIDEIILLDRGQSERRNQDIKDNKGFVDAVMKYAGVAKIRIIAPQVSQAGALMEHIKLSEAENLLKTVVSLVDADAPIPAWTPAPKPPAVLNSEANRIEEGNFAKFEALLDDLAETSAVFGHEGPIRAKVRAALPQWARERIQTDQTGNLWVEVGPSDGQATVLMAHMDEVGFEITAIDDDGVVHMKTLGGVVRPSWEGQPALMQMDAGIGDKSVANPQQLKGVFLSRAQPTEKVPAKVDAWFGMDGAALSEAGVTIGMAVTGYKEGHRMGKYRYSSRGLDDRVGVTALLTAINEIDPDDFNHRVIFAWSVREEGGLVGAAALAERYGPNTKRIYSVDTFVSSDTPLESPHFAYAPLGDGPVLRSIENSSMARPHELDRNRKIAADAGIKVQIGITQGGTDGTRFTSWGAPNAGLSWPGRYSHGPAELGDLRDMVKLVELIKAMALAEPN